MTEDKFPRWRRALATIVAGLVLGAGIGLAQALYESARPVRRAGEGGVQTWYRTGLTGTDSRSDPSALDVQTVQKNDTYVRVVVRGSIPGATCQVAVWTAGVDGTLDVAEVQTMTFTTSSDPNTNGYQGDTPKLYFDCAGDSYYAVAVPVVSSGTVDVKASTIGDASIAAE